MPPAAARPQLQAADLPPTDLPPTDLRPALPPELLARPLDYLVAEHHRQRAFCRLLEQAVEAGAACEILAALVVFLRRDLAVHAGDEEEELYQLLRRRCRAGDGIEGLIGRLTFPERERLDGHLVEALSACAEGRCAQAPAQLADAARRYTRLLRLHIAYCNGILLPLARRRLRRADLEALSQRLRQRHEAAEGARP